MERIHALYPYTCIKYIPHSHLADGGAKHAQPRDASVGVHPQTHMRDSFARRQPPAATTRRCVARGWRKNMFGVWRQSGPLQNKRCPRDSCTATVLQLFRTLHTPGSNVRVLQLECLGTVSLEVIGVQVNLGVNNKKQK